MFGYVLGYDTRLVDLRLSTLPPPEKFLRASPPNVVGVMRPSGRVVVYWDSAPQVRGSILGVGNVDLAIILSVGR
ncbi:hypothetical protein TNCV_664531 [Trichonephila clavipes]|nr:hypothetical protein TNCV_664531 [Trichonephila clavipes]